MHNMYITTLALLAGVVSAIWPVPISYSEGNATVVLSNDFTIEFIPPKGIQGTGCNTNKKVCRAIDRTYDLLNDGFIPNMLYPFEEDFEPSLSEMATSQTLEKLIITQTYHSLTRPY
jgi:hypothetical protein